MKRSNQVVVLGGDLAEKLFGNSNAIGQQLRVGNTSFQMIGMLTAKGSSVGADYDDAGINTRLHFSKPTCRQEFSLWYCLRLPCRCGRDSESVDAAEFQID